MRLQTGRPADAKEMQRSIAARQAAMRWTLLLYGMAILFGILLCTLALCVTVFG